ncbi:MAG TPA: hypothetical protein DDW18_01760 [Firmicutes bacterium]|nr:hypothetical protein [Bacillota bacterium]
MDTKVYIASQNQNNQEFNSFIEGLKQGGFSPLEATKEINDEDLYFLDLSNVSLKELEENYPWLKEELLRSSIYHLRILPLFIYDSRKEDPFEKWEEGANEIYESLFSEEFKAFAYDISNPSYANEELKRVLSLYYVR